MTGGVVFIYTAPASDRKKNQSDPGTRFGKKDKRVRGQSFKELMQTAPAFKRLAFRNFPNKELKRAFNLSAKNRDT